MPAGNPTSNPGTPASDQEQQPSEPSSPRFIYLGTVEATDPHIDGLTCPNVVPNRYTLTTGKVDPRRLQGKTATRSVAPWIEKSFNVVVGRDAGPGIV